MRAFAKRPSPSLSQIAKRLWLHSSPTNMSCIYRDRETGGTKYGRQDFFVRRPTPSAHFANVGRHCATIRETPRRPARELEKWIRCDFRSAKITADARFPRYWPLCAAARVHCPGRRSQSTRKPGYAIFGPALKSRPNRCDCTCVRMDTVRFLGRPFERFEWNSSVTSETYIYLDIIYH